MKITFLGAAHEVTGSCTYLSTCGKNILVDYGMEQGRDVYENEKLPVPASQIDYVLLTHAHIDHSGLLPLLYQNGFRGEIHATKATAMLCDIMLRDSAHIQTFEAEWRNRKGKRQNKEKYVPLYTMDDALGAISLLCPHDYQQRFALCAGVEVRFSDAGHLLGSSSIEIWMTEGEQTRKIVFSGDIGNVDQPILRDPQTVKQADYVVTEATYGTRLHEKPADYAKALAEVFQRTFDRGGSVIIPAFAVGRTQELLYFIRRIKAEGMVKGHDGFCVYVDSPLAIEATGIFGKCEESCFDDEALALVRRHIDPIKFPELHVSVTSADSIAINADEAPKVVLAASGMCEAGRIKHHLKHHLWRRQDTILFVGYQAEGTTGRALLEGAAQVKVFGEPVAVMAEIKQLPGISGHADQAGLKRWMAAFDKKPRRVFVNHGQSSVCDEYAALLKRELGLDTYAPFSGAQFDLLSNTCLSPGVKKPVAKTPPTGSKQFAALRASVERLRRLAEASAEYANKDLVKLTEKINALCEEWEK